MELNEVFWNETIEEIVSGYKETDDEYSCIFCRKSYQKGRIYDIESNLYDSVGAVKHHTKDAHGFTIDYLLSQNNDIIGISEVQQNILKLMSEGLDDKAISKRIGIAQSTVRNHRYKLREKRKQAKLFIALMTSLELKTNRPIKQSDIGNIDELHLSASMIDERYNITDSEREKVIKTYMDENGAIKQFPPKEKRKIILLREVIKNFKVDREYSEKEVNAVLKRIYEDYATIRRALIEYGFFDRSDDCSIYRVKE